MCSPRSIWIVLCLYQISNANSALHYFRAVLCETQVIASRSTPRSHVKKGSTCRVLFIRENDYYVSSSQSHLDPYPVPSTKRTQQRLPFPCVSLWAYTWKKYRCWCQFKQTAQCQSTQNLHGIKCSLSLKKHSTFGLQNILGQISLPLPCSVCHAPSIRVSKKWLSIITCSTSKHQIKLTSKTSSFIT